MSTSATHSGTTTRAGRSGKGLGIAAAVLAVVIAAGFVFAANQGNEVTGAQNELSGPAQIASQRHAERVRLYELAAAAQTADSLQSRAPSSVVEQKEMAALAEQVKRESHPGFNIEKTKMELAGLLGGVGVRDEGNLDMIRAQQAAQAALLTEHPGVNPERTRMLIDKLDEQMYVPSIVQPVVSEPAELNLPEWDNRIP